jgi:hypothetical protein
MCTTGSSRDVLAVPRRRRSCTRQRPSSITSFPEATREVGGRRPYTFEHLREGAATTIAVSKDEE